MTQCERIIDYIKFHGSITQEEASKYIAVGRLAARVSDLKKQGVNIITERVNGKNRFGAKTNFARYRIAHE